MRFTETGSKSKVRNSGQVPQANTPEKEIP
jgi:hypothetical protein